MKQLSLSSIESKSNVSYIKKLKCILFDHKWKYNFGWMPNKRTCLRCDKREKMIFNQNPQHPGDLEIWVDQ